MLPSEVLLDVLHCVDRRGLDALQITTQLLRSLVELDLNESNLRLIRLNILEKVPVIPRAPYANEDARDVALSDLPQFLRGSKVYDVSLCAIGVDVDFIARLGPLNEYVTNIHLGPPISFASEAALRTFFTEFTNCRTVTFTDATVAPRDVFFTATSFFTLPGIRDACQLNFYYVRMAAFPVREATEWLNSGAPNEEKKLNIETSEDVNDGQSYDSLIVGLRKVSIIFPLCPCTKASLCGMSVLEVSLELKYNSASLAQSVPNKECGTDRSIMLWRR